MCFHAEPTVIVKLARENEQSPAQPHSWGSVSNVRRLVLYLNAWATAHFAFMLWIRMVSSNVGRGGGGLGKMRTSWRGTGSVCVRPCISVCARRGDKNRKLPATVSASIWSSTAVISKKWVIGRLEPPHKLSQLLCGRWWVSRCTVKSTASVYTCTALKKKKGREETESARGESSLEPASCFSEEDVTRERGQTWRSFVLCVPAGA